MGVKGPRVRIPAPRPSVRSGPLANTIQPTCLPVGISLERRGNLAGKVGVKWVGEGLPPLEVVRMRTVRGSLRLIEGGGARGRKSPLEAGYEHFRLDRMGNRASPNTLIWYDDMIRPFLAWADEEGVRRFEDLGVERLRHYRALVASRPRRPGGHYRGLASSTPIRR